MTAKPDSDADPETLRLASSLTECIGRLDSALVAFSAGVDSTVVAKATCLALGDRAAAAIGVSPALPEGELQAARELTKAIGIRLVEVDTQEIHDENYLSNPTNRCFFCKDELYAQLAQVCEQQSLAAILNGANADDTRDHRPGMRAATEHKVLSPLIECGIDKAGVRRLAQHWGLPVWDKPASPCLASRVAYGEPITRERLARIDAAERWIRGQGPREVRVRLHEGEHARVEVPREWVDEFTSDPLKKQLTTELHRLGFQSVEIDPDGFRSGSLNAFVPAEELQSATNAD